jgi:hypothetical protein
LRVNVNCGLRRGAWYPVVRLAKDRAVLEVTDDRVPVPRRLLQTVFSRPFHWSIVPLPEDAVNVPSDWGTRYAVCPACQGRAPISGFSLELACPHCRGVFAVAWDERYLRRR